MLQYVYGVPELFADERNGFLYFIDKKSSHTAFFIARATHSPFLSAFISLKPADV